MAISFVGTIPNLGIFGDGKVVLDPSSYFSSTNLPLTYEVFNLPTSASYDTGTGEITFTDPLEGIYPDIYIVATNQLSQTAQSNLFRMTVNLGTGSLVPAELAFCPTPPQEFVDPTVTARIEAATAKLEAEANQAEALIDDLEAAIGGIGGGVTSVNTRTGAVVLDKSDVGLDNVDNTSDLNKPISTATQTALNGKLSSVVAGTNITIDNTDPQNPVISSTGGGGGGATNLAYVASATDGTVTSDTGTDATIPAGSTTNASLMLPADKTKLDGVATGATANQTDAFLLNRTNHTGTQAISTVTGLQTALDGKQATLVSGTNIKTINGTSVLGSGDLVIAGGGVDFSLPDAVLADFADYTSIHALGAGAYWVQANAAGSPNLPQNDVDYIIEVQKRADNSIPTAQGYVLTAKPAEQVNANIYGLQTYTRYVDSNTDLGWRPDGKGGVSSSTGNLQVIGNWFGSYAELLAGLKSQYGSYKVVAYSNVSGDMPATTGIWFIDIEPIYTTGNDPTSFLCRANQLSSTPATAAATYIRYYTTANDGTWTQV